MKPTPAATRIAPPPPLPVQPKPLPPISVAPPVAAAPAARRDSLQRILAVLTALVVAAVLIVLARDNAIEQRLVCSPESPLHQMTFGGLIAPCRDPEDSELKAYKAAIACAETASQCSAAQCFGGYLEKFANGVHRGEIISRRERTDAACTIEQRLREQREQFDKMQACLAAQPACEQRKCIEDYRGKLTLPEFAGRLGDAERGANAACDGERYATFTACLAQTAACDAAECARKAGAVLNSGPSAADVRRLLEQKKTECASPDPKPEDAARSFLERFYQVHSEKGVGPAGALEDLYGASVRVKIFGGGLVARTGPQQAHDKFDFLSNYTEFRYTISRPIAATCASQRKCTINALIRADYLKTGASNPAANMYRVILEVEDVLTRPRVVYEELQRP